MSLMNAMDILATSLAAQRVRMNVASSNLANARTTRAENGEPYKRRDVVFSVAEVDEELGTAGVDIDDITEDQSAPKRVYDPGHPDADEEGYVMMPNIHLIEEMVNMITASRAYEAGVSAMQQVTTMAERSLSIGKR